MRDDDGQRALVLRTHVDEVDVEPVDLGGELGQGVELRLALAPVVVRRPVAREVLERRERHALRGVRDGLLLRPPRGLDAPAKIIQLCVGGVVGEGADRGFVGRLARSGRCVDEHCFSVGGCHGCILGLVVGRGEHKGTDRQRGSLSSKKAASSQRRIQSCLGQSTSRNDKLVASKRVLRLLDRHGHVPCLEKGEVRLARAIRLRRCTMRGGHCIRRHSVGRLDDGIAQYHRMSRDCAGSLSGDRRHRGSCCSGAPGL